MDAATRQSVRQRALDRCEYCRLPQSAQPFVTFHVEHIIARQHGGTDHPDNLWLACERCNAAKGPNLSGRDSATGNIERLFDPRHQEWPEHFQFQGPVIVGLTPVGRATVDVLKMTDRRRVQLRAELQARGDF
ncbi:MAG: HNH endonuclease [Isosphaeraceae bacterium]